MTYAILQFVVIAAVVAFSLVHIGRKAFPQTAQSLQARLARTLRQTGIVGFERLGERLQPEEVPAKGCSDNAGCGSCNMCGTVAALTRDLPKPHA